MTTVRRVTWVPVAQLSRELDESLHHTLKLLRKIAWVYPPRKMHLPYGGYVVRWDARCIDLLRAMTGKQHRTLEPAQTDWLATYLKENSRGTSP